MPSFCLGSLFGRGQTRALVDSALPHAPIASHREGRTAAANAAPRRHHPPTAPIDDRDRVESGSPLPRRLTVAIP
jgi:hypothetical protein